MYTESLSRKLFHRRKWNISSFRTNVQTQNLATASQIYQTLPKRINGTLRLIWIYRLKHRWISGSSGFGVDRSTGFNLIALYILLVISKSLTVVLIQGKVWVAVKKFHLMWTFYPMAKFRNTLWIEDGEELIDLRGVVAEGVGVQFPRA